MAESSLTPEAEPEQLKVVAYLTTDEEGSPAMLFFDAQEAGNYCAIDEDPAGLVLKSEAQSALTAQAATIAQLEARLREAEAKLPQHLPTRVQVAYCPGAWDTFIFGVSGALTMEALIAIDASIRDEDAESLFDKGPGEYLLSASYFKGQYGFEGRCELAPGWELSIEAFTPIDAAIAAHGKDEAHDC